ncbi:hypothetical protein CRG98_018663 [Punica granatum]|uniref:Uncharacterized protein n=1 Tax=Punica granatum TaxID=22663 RepID=A0A2I0JXB7_PUNGR|nr:hypothetical protein CRG98_018663 [Punica granatum]
MWCQDGSRAGLAIRGHGLGKDVSRLGQPKRNRNPFPVRTAQLMPSVNPNKLAQLEVTITSLSSNEPTSGCPDRVMWRILESATAEEVLAKVPTDWEPVGVRKMWKQTLRWGTKQLDFVKPFPNFCRSPREQLRQLHG